MDDFSQPIEVVILGQRTSKLDKLVLIDDLSSSRVKEDISSRLADDGETERRIIAPSEAKVIVQGCRICIGVDSRLRHKSFGQYIEGAVRGVNIRGGDLDVKAIIRLEFNGQVQCIDICTIYVASISGQRKAGGQSEWSPLDIRRQVTRTGILRVDCFRIVDIRKQWGGVACTRRDSELGALAGSRGISNCLCCCRLGIHSSESGAESAQNESCSTRHLVA